MVLAIDREPASDRLFMQIADQIEARINAGEFAEGDRLPSERNLAIEYGSSRITVREALLTLQARGLIQVEHKARARIKRPDSTDMLSQLSGAARNLVTTREGIANLQEARMLFECGLARHAARHGTPKQIEKLELALAENRRAINDPGVFIATDMAFHLAIAEIAGNPIFVSLHEALGQWLVEQRTMGLRLRGSIRAVYKMHEAIYEAIAAHDCEAADRAMADHITQVARFYWKAAGP